jgi:hypothetical protein
VNIVVLKKTYNTLTISNSQFVNNTVQPSSSMERLLIGGSILLVQDNQFSQVVITDSLFLENQAVNMFGGCIGIEGTGLNSSISIRSSTFTRNRALAGAGWFTSNLEFPILFSNNTFVNNSVELYGPDYATVRASTEIVQFLYDNRIVTSLNETLQVYSGDLISALTIVERDIYSQLIKQGIMNSRFAVIETVDSSIAALGDSKRMLMDAITYFGDIRLLAHTDVAKNKTFKLNIAEISIQGDSITTLASINISFLPCEQTERRELVQVPGEPFLRCEKSRSCANYVVE